MSAFENPYIGFSPKSGNAKLIHTWIDAADYELLQNIRPGHGTITIAVNLLIKKLVDECKLREYHDFTRQAEFEHLVANTELRMKE